MATVQEKAACGPGQFKDHTQLCIELIDDAIRRGVPGDFTFDSYFTSTKVLNHIQSTQRAYVGDLKLNRNVVYEGREQKLQDVARQIPWAAKKPVRVGSKRYWYFANRCGSRRRSPRPRPHVLEGAGRRAVEQGAGEQARVLGGPPHDVGLSHRWTGTETFHRDGKQQLGLGDCQARTGEGQTRHVYLVSVAYSLLMRSLHQSRPQDWARRTLTTIGEACRAVKAETLEQMVDWIVDKLIVDHWSVLEIKTVLIYS